ncbi:MAG: hypothetical protein P1P93_08860 [Gammaproteobacteria bacterium]|nr:hypothetical protein [Gammaproteobacteria bacterium]
MKIKVIHVLLTLFTLQAPIIAYAHDKEEHTSANREKPNCEAMKNMDHSKMDMNDPVTQAMMQKCMKNDRHENNSHNLKMLKNSAQDH